MTQIMFTAGNTKMELEYYYKMVLRLFTLGAVLNKSAKVYRYFPNVFSIILHTSLILIITYCRYKSITAKLTVPQKHSALISEIMLLYFIKYSPQTKVIILN